MANTPNVRAGPGFNISNFRAFLGQAGILRNNQFLMTIPYPQGLTRTQEFTNVDNSIQFICDTITFPTTGGATPVPNQRYGYGAVEQRPTIPHFDPLTCTFLCDNAANVLKFFHAWTRLITNFNFDNFGMSAVSNNNMSTYEIEYKANYVSDMNLLIYEQTGQTAVESITFRDAFPVAVQPMPFSWGVLNQQLKIPVSFAFTDWFNDTSTSTPGAGS